MKVLVTGTKGQLVRSLGEIAASRPDIDFLAVGQPELDLRAPWSMAEIATRFSPDVIVNAAAYTAVDQAEDEPELAMEINGKAPAVLAEVAARVGARFVQISTDYVFDGAGDSAFDENMTANPLGTYGRSKLAGERGAVEAYPQTVILRTAWVYSPFGKNFVKTMMAAARTRDTLAVVGDQFGNPTYAIDLAQGIFAMVDTWRATPTRGQGQVYHLAGTGHTSWAGFAQQVMTECEMLGRSSAEVTAITTDQWPTKAPRPRNSRLNTDKFTRDFNYTMPGWQTSTRRAVRAIHADDTGRGAY